MSFTTTVIPPPSSKSNNEGFPTAAIVVIAVGGYLLLFSIGLIIRKCIISKNLSCCPEWVKEQCRCQSCFTQTSSETGCITQCASACNCVKYPNKQQCMDSCCPTKQWCDDTFCFCMSKQPEGQCCKCDDCCGETNCNDCFDCPECKDCCDDCKFECCAQPETIDCCCLECGLRGRLQQAFGSAVITRQPENSDEKVAYHVLRQLGSTERKQANLYLQELAEKTHKTQNNNVEEDTEMHEIVLNRDTFDELDNNRMNGPQKTEVQINHNKSLKYK